MKELVDKLQAAAGLNATQAEQALDVIKNFVKEKFPMFADAVDKLFEGGESEADDDYLQ